jgi:hypothetical protein
VAEDQAEDTFGEYPPFAMTGYSQGGYVVSASDEDTAYPLWRIFAGDSDYYVSSTSAFPGGVYTSGSTYNLGTNSGGSATDNGHWIKLAVPYKLKISHVNIDARTGYEPQAPKNFKFYGSNDDTNWEQIGPSFSNEAPQDDGTSYYTLNSTKAYKYVGLVVTETVGNGNGRLGLQQLKFYGHRENDLVRLPDPTNVLKYPHIAMTGPAQRGYVASASSEFTSLGPYNAWEAFDGIIEGSSYWSTFSGTYNTSNPPTLSYTGTTFATNVEGVNKYGEWLQIEFPHKVIYSYSTILAPFDHEERVPRDGYIVGSNDLTGQWTTLHRFEDVTRTTTTETVTYTPPSAPTQAFKYFRLVIEAISTGGANFAGVDTWELYGTGVDSVPIQIGGGNIDRVANFRVYDKFIDQNQALEIWDAQKDEFGRAKSSMTLQKGRLGIGTTEPQGRLAVLDEPHNLEEFPPSPMTGYKNYFEGHGEFCVSASSYLDLNTYPGWKSFNHTGTSDNYDAWLSADSIYTLNTNVDVDPSVATNINGVYGEWLELKLPYKIILDRLAIKSRGALGNTYGYTSGPAAGNVWGSNDGLNWTLLSSFTGFTYKSLKTSGAIETLHVNSITPYSYFRLQPTKRVLQNPGYTPDSYVAIGELRYFGTREQGQSVLHDGQLTLTKNLNVPRIGPALDADDTPRRDRLVVEYNTSTNPTFEGAVRDTSGRGNDGVFYGGASYDATEKALVFDGTTSDQYVHTLKNGTSESGNIDYSVSLWFNPTTVNVSRWRAIFAIGVLDRTQPTDNNGDEITLFVNNGTNALHLQNGGSSVNTGALNAGQWVHIVVTYDGTNRKIYLDGSLSVSNGYTSLNLPKEMLIRLAQSIPNGGSEIDEYMDCKISNFKTWFGAALTAEEVKTLYDMGRMGNVANPQPLHIATPLYAPGTIVQVEQSIKRDDSSTASTSVSDIPGLSVTIHPKFATSKILVSYQVNMGGNYHMFLRTKRTQNGTTTYVGNGNASGNRPLASSYQSHLHAAHVNSMNMEILDPANGTDPITYQLQFWVSHTNYTAYINRSFDNYNSIYGPAAQSSSITVKEVCQ